MRTIISYRFVIKTAPNKYGLYPIYLRAFLHGKKIEVSTSVTIKPDNWSITKQRVKRNHKEHQKYNQILDAFDKKALKYILNNFVNGDGAVTLKQFKEHLYSTTCKEGSFTDFILKYLEENKSRLRGESWWSYKSQISKMLKFQSPISFQDITEKFILDYQDYMTIKLNNNENTISKSLRSLRTFVNLAIRYEHLKTNPFQYITIKKVDGHRDFLSMAELHKLHLFYETNSNQAQNEKTVLQYFLFSCYTGIRYSDLKLLNREDIQNNTIHIRMHKTSQGVSIPLSQKANQLLSPSKPGKIFSIFCNKVTNRILKKIAIKAGINKKLTFHVARHTFATTSLTLGIPIEVICKLLGHTNIKTTQIYAKVVDSVKEKEIEKWNNI